MASRSQSPRPIVFIVPGQRQAGPTAAAGSARGGGSLAGGAPAAASLPGTLKASVRLGAARSAGESQRIEAVPGEDVVALHIAGGPVLWLHPETARDLMRSQARPAAGAGTARGGAAPAAPALDDQAEVPVTAQLRWHGLEQAAPTRGFMGEVVLAAFEVFTGKTGLKDKAVDFVASQVVRSVDQQVEPGLYALQPERLAKLKGSGQLVQAVPAATAAAGPMLVLIHGTFVETTSTFEKLWTEHPARVRRLFENYAGRVYALDHPTMGASPIGNALTLVKSLPKGTPARLHLVTHSRGGLVAEVLARMAHQRKVGPADLAQFPGEALAAQRNELQELAREIQARDIRVERVVRVACPARGTLLASKRLDAYLSVLKWTLELVHVPVAPTLVDLLAEVARRRADPAQIPGIAAMMPEAPLLQWLNAAPEPIAGDLRVIAGDLRGDGVGSWVKALLADAFYWGDNDIVVHTRAMYAGAPRAGGASYLLDQGGEVTHFNYFANERTAGAVVDALVGAAPPAAFARIGLLSWQGKDASGQRGGTAGTARRGGAASASRGGTAEPTRPAVFVLPGILGSNLRNAEHRLWLGFRIIGGLDKIAYRPGGADGLRDDGPLGMVYDDLIEFLGRSHEVVPFGFDWRRPLEEEAVRLADALDAALDARKQSGQPVRLVAHSMGGLIARTVQLVRPATWTRLMAHRDARLLMLGTPNGGSWAPMQTLSGDDTFGNLLATIGSPLADHRAREVMAAMPGFLQLQAGLTDPALALHKTGTWQKLADDDFAQLQQVNWWHRSEGDAHTEAVYRWGVPPQAVLDQAVALRKRLDGQRERDLAGFADKLLLVIGRARFTPDGYEIGDKGFVYLDASEAGDGRVPMHSALLPGVRTWTLDAEHGSLPSADKAFAAFQELLEKGETKSLEAHDTASRGGAGTAGRALPETVQHVRSRPSRERMRLVPPSDERDLGAAVRNPAAASAGSGDAAPVGAAGLALKVSVLNGDLCFVRQALMVGHYRALKLTGTEYVLDRLVGGAMATSLASGLYPEACGTSQVFANAHRDPRNPWGDPAPMAAIVAGLGDEGELTEGQLALSVRQGTLAWAQRQTEAPAGAPATLSLAATLMGSGGVGISAGASARAMVAGVREANQRLAAAGWPVVTQLTLVELFLDRANDAWRGLRVALAARPGLCNLDARIASGQGARRRPPDSGYRGAEYDLVRITGGGTEGSIEFSLDTRRARTEVRAEKTQSTLVRELVGRAAQHGRHDAQIGRTLFQLLVPPEIEPFLGGTERMVLDLDSRTAPIPWELLDTGDSGSGGDSGERRGADGEGRPWALRCQLLRKLRTEQFRSTPHDAGADDAVLVIGEPLVPEGYAPLPGALDEAQAVHAALTGTGGIGGERTTALLGGADATQVISALMARRYRIVHVAGHGEAPDPEHPEDKPNGVVLSGGVFLGPREIRKMRTVPELVFVNCCHLAAHDSRDTLADRPRFAAGVADALIQIGVRCVVAAGWAVDDKPAKDFAVAFYRELLAGAPFIEAVGAAREAAWRADAEGKTWAAYQCYGDPNWTWRTSTSDAQSARTAAPALLADVFSGIASAVALAQTLEDLTIVQRGRVDADATALQEKLRHLEARFAPQWGGIGAVAEAFGIAHEAAGQRDDAIRWLEQAVAAGDGSAQMKAQETLHNLRARRAGSKLGPSRSALPGYANEVPESGVEARDAGDEIEQALQGLHALNATAPTVERLSLLGSAYKRRALLARGSSLPDDEAEALADSLEQYRRAEALAASLGSSELFYPGLNRMAIELVVHAADAKWSSALDPDATATVRASLRARSESEPSFWSHVGQVEFDLYLALAEHRLAAAEKGLAQAWARVHDRVAHPPYWASVADQALLVLGCFAAVGSAADRRAAGALLRQVQGYASQ